MFVLLQGRNTTSADQLSSREAECSPSLQRAGIFLSNIYSISLKPNVFGVFHHSPHSHCDCFPRGQFLMVSGVIPLRAGPAWNFCSPELLYLYSQGWIQLTRGSAANPLGLHMCLFKCQWPTQAEYLLARACIKFKAQLQFIFIAQSTALFIVVISVPLYLWYYSVSSENLTSTL